MAEIPTASDWCQRWKGRRRSLRHVGEAFSRPGWRPDPDRPQLHLVGNTLLTEWDDHTAKATSDVVMLVRADSAWSIAIVARCHDTFEESAERWPLRRRVDEYVGDAP